MELCNVQGVCCATCSGETRVSGGCCGMWGLGDSGVELGGLNRAMNSVFVTVLTLDSGFFGESVGVVPTPSSDGLPEDAAVFSEADFTGVLFELA